MWGTYFWRPPWMNIKKKSTSFTWTLVTIRSQNPEGAYFLTLISSLEYFLVCTSQALILKSSTSLRKVQRSQLWLHFLAPFTPRTISGVAPSACVFRLQVIASSFSCAWCFRCSVPEWRKIPPLPFSMKNLLCGDRRTKRSVRTLSSSVWSLNPSRYRTVLHQRKEDPAFHIQRPVLAYSTFVLSYCWTIQIWYFATHALVGYTWSSWGQAQ